MNSERSTFRVRHWLVVIAFATVTPAVPLLGAISTTGDVDPDPSTVSGIDTLRVGYTADGTMTVDSGSRVDASTGYIGGTSGITGAAIVDGPGTLLEIYGNLTLGRLGDGSLNIQNSAQAAANNLYLGNFSNASGTLTADGDTTTVRVYNTLVVGRSGSGTLAVQNGGDAVTFIGSVADQMDSTGDASVDGAGSVWHIVDLSIGRRGSATLDITDGGRVESDYTYIGWHAASDGGVTVDGVGSQFYPGALQVATEGKATLNITNGARALSTSTDIGVLSGSTGVVTVDGAESKWYPHALHVGVGGSGEMNIRNGALVEARSVRVGSASSGTGQIIFDNGTLNVLNELKTSPQDLLGTGTINADGIASDIDLLFDATHGVQQQIILNSEPGQNVTINLDQRSGQRLGVGYRGNATLTITDGVTIESGEGLLGDLVGSLGTATVNGLGTAWLNNDGIIVGNEGTGVLSIQGGASVTLEDDLRIANLATASGTVNLIDGTLDLTGNDIIFGQGTSTLNFIGGKLRDARIINTSLHQQGGTFAPGNRIGLGTSLIGGDYTLAAGTLALEIGGSSTHDYDRLEVSGLAMIGGTLDVSLVGGFVPSLGDSFGFLFSSGGFGGSFNDLILPDLSQYGLDWLLNPGGSTLFLNVIEAPIAGDLNGDGFVGIEDLNLILCNWNQSVAPGDPLAGDPTGDGFVGIEDLNRVLGNWNTGTIPPTDVPEPGTACLLSLASLMLIRREHISGYFR